ncbi:MAG TPA: zinc-binding dehydrogenase [Dehalococcoidia bacterium]|nr:zinc-binding dehydrogenase [Dehalococcoidia bacterium]
MRAALSIPGPTGGTVEIRDVPDPRPGDGQVLVRIHAAGINRGELTRIHDHKPAPDAKPLPVGNECAGEVVEVGAGVTRMKAGDRIMCRCNGGIAEAVVINERAAMPLAGSMSWTDAASLPNVCVTAHDALTVSGRLQAGESMLVNAASSGVGIATIQIARLLGATPLMATSRSAAKLEKLKPLGIDCGILTSADLDKEARSATGGKGIDVVIDNVGASVLCDTVKAMAYKGRIVQVGRLDTSEGEIDLNLLAMKRVALVGTSFRMRNAEETLQASEAFAAALLPAVHDGRIRAVVDRVFPFDQVNQAYDYMETNAQIGKIVLAV